MQQKQGIMVIVGMLAAMSLFFSITAYSSPQFMVLLQRITQYSDLNVSGDFNATNVDANSAQFVDLNVLRFLKVVGNLVGNTTVDGNVIAETIISSNNSNEGIEIDSLRDWCAFVYGLGLGLDNTGLCFDLFTDARYEFKVSGIDVLTSNATETVIGGQLKLGGDSGGTVSYDAGNSQFDFHKDISLDTDSANRAISFRGGGVIDGIIGRSPRITGASPTVVPTSSSTFFIGDGSAGVDYAIQINAETNDFTATWMEDEDYFQVEDVIVADENVFANKDLNLTGRLLHGSCGTGANFWAEEAGITSALTVSGFQYSWGDGDVSNYGPTQPCSGVITAISINCVKSNVPDGQIAIAINGVNTICDVNTPNGNNAGDFNICNVPFSAGDRIAPRTIVTPSGTSNGCVPAFWVRYD